MFCAVSALLAIIVMLFAFSAIFSIATTIEHWLNTKAYLTVISTFKVSLTLISTFKVYLTLISTFLVVAKFFGY